MKRVAKGNMPRTLLNFMVLGLAASLFFLAVRVMNERLKVKNSITIIVAIAMEILASRGGFNWDRMPDPRPKNLASNAEMSTFSDKEIFDTVYRDMRDWEDPAVLDDENYFAVPTMPTFKYTLSEEEIWGIVAHVRTLHGMSLTFDMVGRKKELEDVFGSAQQEMETTKATYEAATKRLKLLKKHMKKP